MKTDLYDFPIPDELIAQKPSDRRSDSRLLVYRREDGSITDTFVRNITDHLDKNHLLVFNNSRVRPARIQVSKKSNGRPGELLVLEVENESRCRVVTDKNRKYPPGTEVVLPDGSTAIVSLSDEKHVLIISTTSPLFTGEWFEDNGLIPLPPYIRKSADEADRERYQTIYADVTGSAAAPTAGLHFDQQLFNKMDEQQIERAFVSLHVGLGTFQPVYAEHLENHEIHREEYSIDKVQAESINSAISAGKKVIPVGTTSMRTLESAWNGAVIVHGKNSTRLFIYPPYSFKVCRGLFTNFHTPRSSLLMLVSALTGIDELRRIYDHAVKQRYRFFSYGDAMLVL
jgi:S-adenosylmethionine:tRNA ribosyltransferase-isomerase